MDMFLKPGSEFLVLVCLLLKIWLFFVWFVCFPYFVFIFIFPFRSVLVLVMGICSLWLLLFLLLGLLCDLSEHVVFCFVLFDTRPG